MCVFYDKLVFSKMAYADSVGEELTAVENHLLGAAGAFHCAMGFGCVIGFVEAGQQSSHPRGGVMMMIITMELIVWVLDGYDAYSTGFPYGFMAVQAAIAAIALAIYMNETGIFATKDKSKDKPT
jgi:hypothetical protein